MTYLKVPVSFTIIAAIALIWNLIGVGAFASNLMTHPSTLSTEMQELLSRYPTWTKIAYGVAVIGGTIGALLLLLKNKLAVPFFFASLIGICIQMGHSIFVAKALDVYGPSGVIMPIFVFVIGVFLLFYSRSATAKGWIK